ncbi:vitamin B12 dependent-methionine synthase activation domain-containing protein [Chloroflexota bacterium]
MTTQSSPPTLLTDIPYEPNLDELATWLRISNDAHRAELRDLAAAAQTIARPKALYRLAFIDSRTDNAVTVAEATFTSRILTVNLTPTNRIFPYTATGGTELEAWGRSITDMLHNYWADAIQEQALHFALQALRDHVTQRYQPADLSTMNPGSLEDWPLPQQRPLFDLLGDTEVAIGVQLLDSFLMAPTKSVSGILFEAEKDYYNCQLCPRSDCPNRQAPYDSEKFEREYNAP